jgi:hypothetical protein
MRSQGPRQHAGTRPPNLILYPHSRQKMLVHLSATLMFCLTAVPGCITFYSFKLVDVRVVDAETGRPIPKATVDIGHGHDVNLFNPPTVRAETDEDGRAVVQVGARTGGVEGNAHWSVWAEGYSGDSGNTDDGQRVPARFRVMEDDARGQRVALFKLYIWEHRALQQKLPWSAR